MVFQSTLPARGATSAIPQVTPSFLSFQSTLPARGATTDNLSGLQRSNISIHAPRTGSDVQTAAYLPHFLNFNPRSPHGERRGDSRELHPLKSISIHAPRTGSDMQQRQMETAPAKFQSTLPARGATQLVVNCCRCKRFQSTLPARGATSRFLLFGQHRYYFNPRSPHGERR